jgi:hypothetical protein
MITTMADNDRRPGDSDMHRRQRGKNLFMLAVLLAMAIAFFVLTVVRLGGAGP